MPSNAGYRPATAKDDHYTGKQYQSKTHQSPTGEGGAIRRLACAIRCTNGATGANRDIRITGSLHAWRVALFAGYIYDAVTAARRALAILITELFRARASGGRPVTSLTVT